MRLVALTVLLIGNLFAHQVLAEDVIPQPLTRAACAEARMAWDDNVNVCRAASLAAEPVPEAEGAQTVTDTAPQPLTRADCDMAGMAWDDNANVCGAASLSAAAVPETPETTSQSASEEIGPITTVLINIDKASQK
jgi:hypothetical protein